MFEKPCFVILTNKCNLSCAHCYNELDPFKIIKTKARDPLSRSDLATLFIALQQQGYQRVYLSGGEALSRCDAPDIIADITTTGMKTSLFSNGHLFTDKLIDRLRLSGLGEVRISLNELAWIKNREQYEMILERQTRWISFLIDAGIDVGVIFLISAANIEYVEETLLRVRRMGAGMKVQPLYMPVGARGEENGARYLSGAQWQHLIGQIENVVSETDFGSEDSFAVYNNPWKILRYLRFVADVHTMRVKPNFCPTGPLLVLDSDGIFHPCLFRFDLSLGSIFEEGTIESLPRALSCSGYLKTAPCFREECLSAYR